MARSTKREREAAKLTALLYPPPPAPSRYAPIEEGETLWRELVAAGTPRLARVFAETMRARGHELGALPHHVIALRLAGRHDAIIELARAMLVADPSSSFDWHRATCEAVVALGRLAEARVEMQAMVNSCEGFQHAELVITAMRLHAGESDVATMLYHAGSTWAHRFEDHARVEAVMPLGQPPAALASELAAWLAPWLSALPLGEIRWDVLRGWAGLIETVGVEAFGDLHAVLERERERRNEVVRRLVDATDEASGREAIARIGAWASAWEVSDAVEGLGARAPVAVADFSIAVMKRGGVTDSNLARTVLQFVLAAPVLDDRVAEVYALARSMNVLEDTLLSGDLARAALRLGRREDAFQHLVATMKHWYPDQILAMPEFAVFRGDEQRLEAAHRDVRAKLEAERAAAKAQEEQEARERRRLRAKERRAAKRE